YQKSRSQHFSIIYPVEDSGLISTTIDRFEWTYNQVCADLDCPSSLSVTQLNVKPFIVSPHWSGLNGSYTIVIPSPRITGYYDISGAIMNWELLDDPIGQSTFDTLMPMLTQRLSGGGERWTQSSQGTFFLQAIETWELNRLSVYPNMMSLLPPKQLSNNIPLIKLESLWTLQSTPSNPEQVANSVIFFIEQKYGVDSVSRFLKAIGPAQSFKQVIKNSLGLDEIQFEQQWQDWLKQLYAQGS
ncbi:MAG TPA: hypothetical protein VFK30_14810, partial [Anaerolineae bacterium]|nr:hypothetical protein [Anaerolineae bacterium]